MYMRLFNPDGPVMRLFSAVSDLLLLNFCFMICCVPIFTIGASMSALYAVTLDKTNEASVISRFFSAFRRNFKQATLAWLLVLAVVIILAVEFYLLSIVEVPFGFLIMVALLIVSFLVIGTTLYLFPLIGHFENTLKNTIKNAALLGVSMFPRTMLMIFIWCFPFWMFLIDTELFVRSMLPWMLVGFAVTAKLNSGILRKIFMKIAPEEESKNTDEIPPEIID